MGFLSERYILVISLAVLQQKEKKKVYHITNRKFLAADHGFLKCKVEGWKCSHKHCQ
jgi:hypothetical protein